MLPFVTPTTDTRRDDQRVTGEHAGHVRAGTGSQGLWQGVLLVAVILSAILLAMVLASTGDSASEPVEPTPTIQQ
jgi:hypothetical protein